MKLHSISIDCTKIPKDRLVIGKKGGKWINLIVEERDDDDQFGNNISVIVSQTKEERAEKAKKTFIGNGRTIWARDTKSVRQGGGPSAKHTAPPELENPLADYKDDVVF